MTDNKDELLVGRFFEENRIRIPDDGFSRRVMRNLPDRKRRIGRIWTAVCSVVALLFLIKNDFIAALPGILEGIACDVTTSDAFMQNSLPVCLTALALLVFGGYKAVMEE